ncbi:MAG: response regulator [Lachnospiraceae bacterium]|nr:response regulator [Lachnospiraceae bacterium]
MLIVEDPAMNRAILCDIFTDSFAISEAINGISGLEFLINGGNADIIMLDINMPEMDGFEMLAKLKENDDTKNIPVLITSQIAHKEEVKLKEMGASGFIAKPYTKDAIVEKVDEILNAASAMG